MRKATKRSESEAPKAGISYYEKLQHPLWQKTRLRVLERANYTCEQCGDSETQVHVHHLFYIWGCEPWDYPDYAFKCLCKNCHAEATAEKEMVKQDARALISMIKATGIEPALINDLAIHLHDAYEALVFTKESGQRLYQSVLDFVIEERKNNSA